MCGICGKVSKSEIKQEEIRLMADTLNHRGPDDEGFYLNNCVGLGHKRLSIIDLNTGQQPISNEDKSIWIVFNGEIYNYPSLRDNLLQKGHIFTTNTDTEVIIHLYEEHGDNCVQQLSGMFAFAIWDDKEKKLFLARDRIGQKPLFYMENGDNFLFASEAKALLVDKKVNRSINTEAIHHYLSLRFIPAPQTMFQNIKKLPAGHYLTYRNGFITISRYWDLNFSQKLSLTDDEFISSLNEQLTDTIQSHLISDVPVGSFLSGGMDSSMIVAYMGQLLNNSFKTFSIGVKEQSYNELPYARMVADQYRTEHIERVVEADLIKLIPTLVWHMDEPSDPIAACMFHAANLASEYVKVVLGGDGGDELFAGFDRYSGMNLINYYNLIPSLIRTKLMSPIIEAIQDNFSYKSLPQKMKWVNHLSTFHNGDRYAEATSFFRFNHDEKQSLFNDSLWKELKDINSSNIIVDQYNKPNADDPIDKMLYADFMTRLSEHTLMLTDRMNMAHSLEARSPLLDHPLVELLASFPSNMKIRGRSLKYVFRELAKDFLPPAIIKREKQGFMFPVAYWFKHELYEFIKNYLLQSTLVKEGFFNKEVVLQLIDDHRNNKNDNHVRLWMLLNLEIWYQLNILGQSVNHMEDNITVQLQSYHS